MKKLTYFFMLIFPLLLVSCNDDDGISPEHASRVYRAESLNMTINGKKFSGKSVKFITTDFKTADITFIKTIPGEDSLIVKGVSLLYDGNNIYEFEGSNTSSHRDISFKGKVDVKGGMNIDVTYKVLSDIVGTWQPSGGGFMPPNPVQIVIDSTNPNDSIDMGGFWGYEGKFSFEEFDETIGAIFNMTLGLVVDFKLDFNQAGQMNAAWDLKPGASFPIPPGHLPENQSLYNLNGNYLYLALPVESIIMNPTKPTAPKTTKAADEKPKVEDIIALVKLLQSMYQGMPLKYTLENSNNDLDMWADRAMMEPYFESIVNVLVPILRKTDLGSEYEEMGITGPILAHLLDELGRVFRNSKTFEIHFNFTRVSTEQQTYNNKAQLNKAQIIQKLKSIRKPNNRK